MMETVTKWRPADEIGKGRLTAVVVLGYFFGRLILVSPAGIG